MVSNISGTPIGKAIEKINAKISINEFQKTTAGYNFPENSKLSVSGFGVKINDFFEKIQTKTSTEEVAKRGLNSVTSKIVIELDKEELVNFVDKIDKMSKKNEEGFFNFFETSGKVKDYKLSVGSFVKVFSDLRHDGLQEKFVQEVKSIINEEKQIEKIEGVYNGFINKMKKMLSRYDLTITEVEDFFNKMSKANKIDEKEEIVKIE